MRGGLEDLLEIEQLFRIHKLEGLWGWMRGAPTVYFAPGGEPITRREEKSQLCIVEAACSAFSNYLCLYWPSRVHLNAFLPVTKKPQEFFLCL